MPDEAFTGAVDVVRRRIVRVRRRHALRECARVACLLVASTAITAAVGLALALNLGATAFTISAWLLGVSVSATSLVLVGLGWRRRLRRDSASRWIDQQVGLCGRLTTLVELAGRGPRDAFFLPLLVEQTVDRLPAWPPERLVPRIAPRREIALALGGLAVLALTVTLAPSWRPHRSGNVIAAPPGEATARSGDADTTSERPTTAAPTDPTTLAGLPVAIQSRLRDALWGDDWAELPPAATSRTERPPDRRAPRRPSDDDARLAGLRAEDQAERGAPAPDAEKTDALEHASDDAAGADGAPGPGAGTGTDANLLGTASEPGDGHTTFELALGARVRARRQRPQRSPDEAPPAEPDARPALPASERRVAAVHRMPVPAAYESIVRAAFAHRAPVEPRP